MSCSCFFPAIWLSVLWVLFISSMGGRGNGQATLTPEVMFIEKKKKTTYTMHTRTDPDCGGNGGGGALELHVALLSL